METIFIQQFEEIFKQPFNSVVDIEDLGADTDDNVWLEKNSYKNEILQRLTSILLG